MFVGMVVQCVGSVVQVFREICLIRQHVDEV